MVKVGEYSCSSININPFGCLGSGCRADSATESYSEGEHQESRRAFR